MRLSSLPILSLTILTLGVTGCRPTPYEVATVVQWKSTKPDGRRCYHRCRSMWHGCRSQCGGSTHVSLGVGFGGGAMGVGRSSGSSGCRHHCEGARIDCLRGCDGLEEHVMHVRYCPDGPGRCEAVNPDSPTMRLAEYCRGADGRLQPCGAPPPPPPRGSTPPTGSPPPVPTGSPPGTP